MEILVVGYMVLDSCIKWYSCLIYIPTEHEQCYYFENYDTTITNTISWKNAKLEIEKKIVPHDIKEWEEPFPEGFDRNEYE